MDQHERDNWKKIQAHMEAVGATDNWFYQRAVVINAGKPDPLDDLLLPEEPKQNPQS